MCAALVGGMDRLKKEYIVTAKALGFQLKVFTGQERSIRSQLGEVDVLVLCTGKVSHAARIEALSHAKSKSIPVHLTHSSGVSALKRCLESANYN